MKKGIDISYYQGDVDFNLLKKNGVEFVIIREGYRNTVDPKFFEYVDKAKAAGVTVLGVYHFSYAFNVTEAMKEAEFCIQNVKKSGLDKKNIIVFYDFEYDTVTKAALSGIVLGAANCNAHTTAFCEKVRTLGFTPGVYANLDYYKNWYFPDVLKQYHIWLADYSGGPDFDCLVQQYSSTGKIPGINGNVDLDYYYGSDFKMEGKNMRSRSEVVKLATSWIGKNEADGTYRSIIDIYNSYSGAFPRGVKMQYGWAWCACTWSALAIALGYTDIMPIEISCGELINRAKTMGCWQENDGWIPQPGDAILYDWEDTGSGDNVGWPDHIGTVDYVNSKSGYMTVIEGNYDSAVKKRTISINGKYIRGFITPEYTDNSVITETTVSKPSTGTTAKKDVTTLAREVIAGVWGNDPQRTAALTRSGFDAKAVQAKVNEILNGPAAKPATTVSAVKKIETSCYSRSFESSLAGTYVTTADLYCRNDAGTNKKALCLIPRGTKVQNYGYYTAFNGVKWLLIQFTLNGIQYTGFSSSEYLRK